jgi:hypothetical protein
MRVDWLIPRAPRLTTAAEAAAEVSAADTAAATAPTTIGTCTVVVVETSPVRRRVLRDGPVVGEVRARRRPARRAVSGCVMSPPCRDNKPRVPHSLSTSLSLSCAALGR